MSSGPSVMQLFVLSSFLGWVLNDMVQEWITWLALRQHRRAVRGRMSITDIQWREEVRRRHRRTQRRMAR